MLNFQRAIAIIFVAIGVAALVETLVIGGGEVGFLLAAVFIALGVVRWRVIHPPQ